MDSGLGWWLHLGFYTFHCLVFSRENRTGNTGNSLSWFFSVHDSFFLTMAFFFNAILETNVRSIWGIFPIYHLGHMVIRWFWCYRIELVESVVALANADAIWNSKQKKMVRFHPTKCFSGCGRAAPLTFCIEALDKVIHI